MEIKEERLSRALSAYHRRKILRQLLNHNMTVKELAKKNNISDSLASRHLKLLYDLGFLEVKIEPPYKYYSIKIKSIKKLLDCYDRVLGEI